MSRVRHRVAGIACAMVCGAVAGASTVHAQTASGGRFEIAGGVTWTGHLSLGAAAATETAPGGRFTLFSTSSELTAAPGVDVRVGVRITPAFEVEASSSYARPRLQTAVSGDAEGAPPVTASESVHQYIVDGDIIANLLRWRMGNRATPFVLAGAGYAHELHENQTLAVSGQRYFAGGGIRYLLRSRPHGLKGVGVRADARALAQRKGIAFDNRLRVTPMVAASIFVGF
jgi:opacity protein-like surface antigen